MPFHPKDYIQTGGHVTISNELLVQAIREVKAQRSKRDYSPILLNGIRLILEDLLYGNDERFLGQVGEKLRQWECDVQATRGKMQQEQAIIRAHYDRGSEPCQTMAFDDPLT